MTQAPRMADDVVSPEGVPPDDEGVPPDDAAVIAESCRAPDRFGAVFDRHAVAIHGYIARRLGPDAADDLVAEAFLVAFRKRADYDLGQPSARPWLYGIATRLISRHRRDEVRFFRAIAKTGIDPATGGGDPVADEGIRHADAHALRPRLALALASLSKADRDALLLVTDGLRYEEAARALGIPPGTLSSRVARARRKVQEALGGVGNADDEGERDHG
jgi:RNA polymerase sigma factor (sigma-70 family)